ncbi:RSC complex bromodomain subunit Rsc1 [Schizosaccharomyces pombe]|uniref:Chromatin structure-remodeling complex subunit rsc1 n=1 Tax=Schizosaccharomyces pombe (strain 972 / ATCC 24843) TaxID=284812 RepID=RSC1_SCHPO|nr:RSC complex subunit Rsc1 [Schizosaccharomyces pombe]O74964.1 RecName: Full=Chromatin structure-remodeling complex subunit rsc1; AltName: Full=RSC complex subunit rsc1; AltName: Full=Remodel the structure of chromatin complex subunit 1 [Schizosaccharomyces pombe 972h-]CAA19283.1 RSC complex subunit Rsc1 [Schizosaccharomyces pombe]|eukprot:NP_596420.1 RSC complex subunit Rsc1 [Schizosaccharomyces pombe]
MSSKIRPSADDKKLQRVLYFFLERVRAAKDVSGQLLSPLIDNASVDTASVSPSSNGRPTTLKSIQSKIDEFQYHDFSEFVSDLAYLFINVKALYEGTQTYSFVQALEEFCIQQLRTFQQQGYIPVITWPNTDSPSATTSSPISRNPEYSVSPPNGSKFVKNEDEAYDSDLYVEEEDSDVKGRSMVGRDGRYKSEDLKRRKLQPSSKPLSSLEARAKVIMRQVRRYRDGSGRQLFAPFERLPDPRMFPEYYQAIEQPMALEVIQKKLSKHRYETIEQFVDDFNLMFDNAKSFNDPSSQVYRDADFLKNYLADVLRLEAGKLDSEFFNYETDSRASPQLPKNDIQPAVSIDGTLLNVGDWVLIRNPADSSKPIVSQIYRIWKSDDDINYVTVCWYLRPEQTVHRADAVFYENEVFKTSLYRDHPVSEIVGRCFVMYITRYIRGRPKGIRSTPVFVCESRYNDDTKQFSKIKSWKACMPQEVSGSEYEMILFDRPITLTKVASPLLHLLASKSQGLPSPATTDSNTHMLPSQGSLLPPSSISETKSFSTKASTPLSTDDIATPLSSAPNPPSVMPTYARKTSSHSERSSHSSYHNSSHVPTAAFNSPIMRTSTKSTSPIPARPFYAQSGSLQSLNTTQHSHQISGGHSGRMNVPYAKLSYTSHNGRHGGSNGNISGAKTPMTNYTINSMPSLPVFPPAFIVPGTHQKLDESSPVPGIDDVTVINTETAKMLDKDEHQNVLWYTVPPLDPIPLENRNGSLTHSVEYVLYKKSKGSQVITEKARSNELSREAKFENLVASLSDALIPP